MGFPTAVTRRIALQCTLVHHVGAAVRLIVIDEQTLLEMLSGVGEVETPQLDVASRRRVAHERGQPDQVATKADREVPEHGVAAHLDVVRGDVNCIVGPVVDVHHGQCRLVVDDELDVLGVGSAALLIEDDDGARERLEVDLHVPECRGIHAGALECDDHGLTELDLTADREHRRLVER